MTSQSRVPPKLQEYQRLVIAAPTIYLVDKTESFEDTDVGINEYAFTWGSFDAERGEFVDDYGRMSPMPLECDSALRSSTGEYDLSPQVIRYREKMALQTSAIRIPHICPLWRNGLVVSELAAGELNLHPALCEKRGEATLTDVFGDAHRGYVYLYLGEAKRWHELEDVLDALTLEERSILHFSPQGSLGRKGDLLLDGILIHQQLAARWARLTPTCFVTRPVESLARLPWPQATQLCSFAQWQRGEFRTFES